MTTEAPVLCAGTCRRVEHGGPRRAMPGLALCDVCEDHTSDDLTYLHAHWGALAARLDAQSGVAGTRVSGTQDAHLPVNLAVADARTQITTMIGYWVHVLLTENPGWNPPGAAVPERITWVRDHHHHLTRHPDHGLAASVAVEARALADLTRRFAYPTGARRFSTGTPCPEHVDPDGVCAPCPGTLTARITEQMDYMPDLVCDTDPAHRFDPSTWRRLRRPTLTETS